jgi:hypothetical protein
MATALAPAGILRNEKPEVWAAVAEEATASRIVKV